MIELDITPDQLNQLEYWLEFCEGQQHDMANLEEIDLLLTAIREAAK